MSDQKPFSDTETFFCCTRRKLTKCSPDLTMNMGVRLTSILDISIIIIVIIIYSVVADLESEDDDDLDDNELTNLLISLAQIFGLVPATLALIYGCKDVEKVKISTIAKIGKLYYYTKLVIITLVALRLVMWLLINDVDDINDAIMIILPILNITFDMMDANVLFSYFNLMLQGRVTLVYTGKEEKDKGY